MIVDIKHSRQEGKDESLHVTLKNEHLFSSIPHDILAQIVNQECKRDGVATFVLRRQLDFVSLLVRKEHFEAAAVS